MQYTLSLTSHHTRQRRLTHTDGSLHTSEWHSNNTGRHAHGPPSPLSLSLSTTILSRSTTLHYNSPLLSSLSQHGLSTPGHLHSTTTPALTRMASPPPPPPPPPSSFLLPISHYETPYGSLSLCDPDSLLLTWLSRECPPPPPPYLSLGCCCFSAAFKRLISL